MENDLNFNQKQLDMLAKLAKQKTGMNVDEMKQSIVSGNLDQFISKNMDANAAAQLKKVLTDKQAAQQMLNTPEAQALLRKLSGK